MPPTILPDTFGPLLAAFGGCFHRPSHRTFGLVVAGWIHCLGRHTLTAVALASGAIGERHVSVFHRFFTRAVWVLDELGRVVFTLAMAWIGDGHLTVLIDDTLARKGGKCISLASMHHDPLRSTARKPFFSFGHVWVVLALWVPLPVGGARGVALPILFRLYVGAKRGGQTAAPSRPGAHRRLRAAQAAAAATPIQTKLELAREMVAVVARWAPDRTVYAVTDSLYAGRVFLDDRPGNVHVVSRLRMDAALWRTPPDREPGKIGRPRRRGDRVPSPLVQATAREHWHRLPVTLYGRAVTTQVFRCTALWYAAIPNQPVRIVVVRDPNRLRRDEAFFCTDRSARAAFILETYARRWTLEVAFHDTKQFLGFADPQCQSSTAVRRAAPIAFIVYALVVLWHAAQVRDGHVATWPTRPWYRQKRTSSFLDMLTTLRREAWRQSVSSSPSRTRRRQNPHADWFADVLATA